VSRRPWSQEAEVTRCAMRRLCDAPAAPARRFRAAVAEVRHGRGLVRGAVLLDVGRASPRGGRNCSSPAAGVLPCAQVRAAGPALVRAVHRPARATAVRGSRANAAPPVQARGACRPSIVASSSAFRRGSPRRSRW
jgi:hypothetical protein